MIVLVAATFGLPIPAGSDTPATASVSGVAWEFAFSGGSIAGATVTLLEQPGLSAVTDGSGRWQIDGVPVGGTVTPVLTWVGGPTIQTATLPFTADVGDVVFQAPNHDLTGALAGVLGVSIDPTRCQIAATVTRRGHDMSHPAPDGTHGEPFATVALDPWPGSGGADGPVYFNLARYDVIWPDRALSSTTSDGGVLFANVVPGDYTLRATKAGADIAPVRVNCRAGVITNAAPPRGLQVLSGGLDLDDVVPPPPPSSTTTTTTTATTVGSSTSTTSSVADSATTGSAGSGAPGSVTPVPVRASFVG